LASSIPSLVSHARKCKTAPPSALGPKTELFVKTTVRSIATVGIKSQLTTVAGNPFQATLSYRGFDASSVPGTPQGLAVYQDGIRINEAFATVCSPLMLERAVDR
jgi:hypothetical protein